MLRPLATMLTFLSAVVWASCGEAGTNDDQMSIGSQPGAVYPVGQTSTLDLDDLPLGEGLNLEVIVSDGDVSQRLEYRVFVDLPPEMGLPSQQNRIEPSGTVDRSLTVVIPQDALTPGRCNQVELIVAGQFGSFVDPRAPAEPGDSAEAVWWFEIVDEQNPVVTAPCEAFQ